jgi:hypothetical protein
MAFSIGIGDIILLSKFALNVGRAFTSGRKAAPPEFHEVQALLSSLSDALDVIAKDLPSSRDIANSDGGDLNALVGQIYSNCRKTLVHLETLVGKYLELDINQGAERRWKEEMRKCWKKIIWTQEGGAIASLKLTFTSHINALNLAINAMHKWVDSLTHAIYGDTDLSHFQSANADTYGLDGRETRAARRDLPVVSREPEALKDDTDTGDHAGDVRHRPELLSLF